MADDSGLCCPLSWQSRKIRKVCKSTLAAESLSLVEGLESAELIGTQLKEMFPRDLPIVGCVDCKSLFDAVKTSNTLEDKGLRIPMASLRQKYSRSEVKFVWVPTHMQLADCMTKAGASAQYLRDVLAEGRFSPEIVSSIQNRNN